ncbi:hypothetical protein C6P46_002083 [Rhodotorula mucilaginosa]|uniref:DUF1279 domain-containing protein n=1 Tax=Rhodotorula mucilaginosa TaxID=5537 RepID=A0A9P6W6E4_RHOMI|nr:hypothetical protein C6P46_002083 [Rhodotorula mucilaginosa]
MLKAPALRSALARAPPSPSPAVVRTFSSSASASVWRLGPAAAQHPVQWAAYAANRNARIAASPRARNFWSSSSSSSSSANDSSSGRSQQQQQQNKEQEQGSAESEDPQKIPLTQKVKYLFRKYGWTTLVVYLGLSAVDFGLCFLVIYSVGADRVRSAEDWVLDKLHWKRRSDDKDKAEGGGGGGNRVQRAVEGLQQRAHDYHAKHVSGPEAHPSPAAADAIAQGASTTQVVRAEQETGQKKSKYGTIATTAVLAYAIHKTLFLPVRVGITVAITPKVVRMLQGWGWKVGMAAGAPPTAAAAAATAAAGTASGGSAAP